MEQEATLSSQRKDRYDNVLGLAYFLFLFLFFLSFWAGEYFFFHEEPTSSRTRSVCPNLTLTVETKKQNARESIREGCLTPEGYYFTGLRGIIKQVGISRSLIPEAEYGETNPKSEPFGQPAV